VLHDLRHFYASGLINAGCDVVTVQRAMGHKSATVTLNTYAHRWPKAEDRTRNAAAALFADAVSTTADQLRTDSGQTGADLCRYTLNRNSTILPLPISWPAASSYRSPIFRARTAAGRADRR
jgi:Phage integrase family